MSQKILIRALAVAVLFFICLGAGVIGGIDFPFDVAVIHHLETVRASSPELTLALIAVTQAGSAWATIGSGLGVAAWLGWRRHLWLEGVLGATVVSGRLAIDGLKLLIDRTRPTFDLHPVVTHSSSFPSGHAGNSMTVFLAIALIASPRRYRLAAVSTAVLASLIIGATRPYLGVHWPSDVIGGWALGAGMAIIAWTFAESRQVNRDAVTASDYLPASHDVPPEQSPARSPQP